MTNTIHISKLLEGGVDLRTGQVVSRCVELECGGHVMTLPVTEEQMLQVIELFSLGNAGSEDAVQEELVHAPVEPTEILAAPQSTPHLEMVQSPVQHVQRRSRTFAEAMAEDARSASVPGYIDDDYAPGEEYFDSETGIASL